jgi:phage tail sheath protein FI
MDTHGTMITDLCELRKDCVGFISPYRAATVGVSSTITQTSNVIAAFDLLPSSSYIVYDSGYKYMYDKYNDVYRFVPLNGDIAGLCANADKVADPWYSPAGYNRGAVRGAIKLSYNPKNSERDQLYRSRINPVTNFPGQGVILFGDKTALTKPSAFDRINVRRLFLVLEKAIATASKYQLFEFNDEFTRASFRNMIEPFLRDVQGRRGIFDFKVVCDSTNNTGEVIDRNEFIGDIYIKPARSINFITLNFVAVRTGVAFSEVIGQWG